MAKVTMETDNIAKYARAASDITEQVAPSLIRLANELVSAAKDSNASILTSQVAKMEEATTEFLKVNKQFAETVRETAVFLKKAESALS